MKRLVSVILTVLLMILPFLAQAEENNVEWTFGVPLEDINTNFLILANNAEPLPENYVPTDLETIRNRHNDEAGNVDNAGLYLATSTKVQLKKTVISAVGAMMAEAESQGAVLYIRGGYRSYAEQQKKYERAVKKGNTAGMQPAAACDYVTGMAVTLVGYNWRGAALNAAEFAASPEAQWLAAHAADYGFILRYPQGGEQETGNAYEPWHYRYVGKGVSRYMAAHGLTLEGFMAELNQAYADFEAAGGDLQAAIASTSLPEGPVELQVTGPDGDHEIVLFHD